MALINKNQSNEERRIKYGFMRLAGLNYHNAMRMRDWTISHMILFLKSNDGGKIMTSKERKIYLRNKKAAAAKLKRAARRKNEQM